MFLTNFGQKYPELAKKETRILTILQDGDNLLKGDYIILEMYCTDPTCDCRKVSFYIIGPNKEIYYLDYGFEEPKHYIRWGIGDYDLAKEMSGLSVNSFSGNIENNKKIFENIKYILNDEKYVERLKKHYELMKEKVDGYKDPLLFDDNISMDDYDNKNIYDINKSTSLQKKVLKDKKKRKN